MFGRTDDLRLFWDLPPAQLSGLVTEQYLWLCCLARSRHCSDSTVELERLKPTLRNMLESEQGMLSNFFVVDTDRLGIRLPEKTANNPIPHCRVHTCYSTSSWERLSRAYAQSDRPFGRYFHIVLALAMLGTRKMVDRFLLICQRIIRRTRREIFGSL